MSFRLSEPKAGGAPPAGAGGQPPPPAKAARHPHRAKAPSSQNPNARKRQRIPEQMRKWLGEPRGDQPRDVIPVPSAGGPRGDHPRDVIPGPSAGDSLAAGNIDLPEEVANDELDDLFVDVKTASPKKEDRPLAKTLRKKRKAAGGTRAPGLGAPADGGAHPGVLPLVEAMAVVAIKDLSLIHI